MILSLESVTKAYGREQPVFRNLSLVLRSEERTALVGPSGCGKSTLLRLIAGLLEPDEGHIAVNGRRVGEPGRAVQAWKEGIGLVFQDGALFPHLTVLENAVFGLDRRDSHRWHIARESLGLVGLLDLETRYPHQLSGGQQQRVALARALAPRPAFLLLDEPFAGLDSRTKTGLIEELDALCGRLGTGLLLVTHDEDDAHRLAGRIVVLDKGRLSASASIV